MEAADSQVEKRPQNNSLHLLGVNNKGIFVAPFIVDTAPALSRVVAGGQQGY